MDFINQWRENLKLNKISESVSQANKLFKTIDSLRNTLSDNRVSEVIKNRINALMTLVKTKPNISGVNHYLNHFLLQLDPEQQIPVFKELLEVYQERWKNIDIKTAEVIFNWLNLSEKPSILVNENDAVLTSVLDLLKIKQKEAIFYIPVSNPDKSGIELSKAITDKGFKVVLFEDNALAHVIPQVDIIWLFCHQVLHEKLIAAKGSLTITHIALHNKKPIYAIADTRRLLNAKYFSQKILDTLVGDLVMETPKDWITKSNIESIIHKRDFIPNHFMERIFLEIGTFTAEEIKKELDKTIVTRFL